MGCTASTLCILHRAAEVSEKRFFCLFAQRRGERESTESRDSPGAFVSNLQKYILNYSKGSIVFRGHSPKHGVLRCAVITRLNHTLAFE